MRNNTPNNRYIVFLLFAVMALLLSACGAGNADATPTMSVDEIYTAAFYTLEAQQATMIALTPSATSTPVASPTLPPSPTSATLLAPSGNATTAAGGAQGCDNSVYVNDVTIPDGTVMTPGKNFVKTWTLMNNGTCAWGAGYKLTFISGETMGGSSVPISGSVPAGQQAPISVSLVAPATAGDFTGWWRLQNPAGQYFGNSVSVVIKVGSGGSSASTNTPGTPAAPTETATP